MIWVLVLLIGLVAGTLAGVIGFGGTTVLLPILTLMFGPKAAVPIMAIASILGNFSRVVAWWRVINWRAVAAYSVTAVPAAWLGARTMLALDPKILEISLGIFFIAMIPIRRWFAARGFTISLLGLAAAGGIIGYLTGIVANTGPINTPFFLAYGLTRGAFVGTEAMSSLSMFTSKTAAFRSFGALPWDTIVNGLAVGSTLMVGTFLAKRFLQRINEATFRGLIELILLGAGLAMIASGLLW
ncbi:MAG TPA: sulfite exporter TauE/SafE family protein [Hyphomicrobiaceae bacterium]|nr:sulfite exporter TauE/SafE family protein [Hyphomicrobiaceae bacterium]